MTKRRVVWGAIVLLTLIGLALLVPVSPAYVPNLMMRYGHLQEGHGTGYWIDALNTPDTAARRHAIYSLGMLGPAAEDAVPAVTNVMLHDPDGKTRGDASLALLKMLPASRNIVPELAQALSDPEPVVRMNAATILFRLKEDSRPAVPALIAAMKDKDNEALLTTFTISIQEMVALALGLRQRRDSRWRADPHRRAEDDRQRPRPPGPGPGAGRNRPGRA